MNAFECYQYTGQQLRGIANVQDALNKGAIKQNDLPEEFAENIKPENKARLVAANKKSFAQLQEELNEWL